MLITDIVALYGELAQAEAALHELQGLGVPYPSIVLHAHDPATLQGLESIPHLPQGPFWSLTVSPDAKLYERAEAVLRAHSPISVGHPPAGPREREVDQGAVAWRHFVFEAPAPTASVTDAAGTSGTTGVINSGAFQDRAQTAE